MTRNFDQLSAQTDFYSKVNHLSNMDLQFISLSVLLWLFLYLFRATNASDTSTVASLLIGHFKLRVPHIQKLDSVSVDNDSASLEKLAGDSGADVTSINNNGDFDTKVPDQHLLNQGFSTAIQTAIQEQSFEDMVVQKDDVNIYDKIREFLRAFKNTEQHESSSLFPHLFKLNNDA